MDCQAMAWTSGSCFFYQTKSRKFISFVLLPTLLVRMYPQHFNYSDNDHIKNIQQTKLRDSDYYVTECDKGGLIFVSNIELKTHKPCNKMSKHIFCNHPEEPMEKKFKFYKQFLEKSIDYIVRKDSDCNLCSLPL